MASSRAGSLPQRNAFQNVGASLLAKASDPTTHLQKYFQICGEVNPSPIRVVTETASHSHPLRFYTGH
jgi:hypothetical protein